MQDLTVCRKLIEKILIRLTHCAFLLQNPTGLIISPSFSSEVLSRFSIVSPCSFSLSIAAKFTLVVKTTMMMMIFINNGNNDDDNNESDDEDKKTSSLVWLESIRLTRHWNLIQKLGLTMKPAKGLRPPSN